MRWAALRFRNDVIDADLYYEVLYVLFGARDIEVMCQNACQNACRL